MYFVDSEIGKSPAIHLAIIMGSYDQFVAMVI